MNQVYLFIFSLTVLYSCSNKNAEHQLLAPPTSHCVTEPQITYNNKEQNEALVLDTTLCSSLNEALRRPLEITKLELTRLDSEIDLMLLRSEVSKFKNLVELRITNSTIEFLPEGIGELDQLETLILNDNFELKELPASFCQLKKLKYLDLSLSGLNHFPKVICELENLEFLNVMKTGLQYLPVDIKNLKNLRILYLNNNPLKKIPKELGGLTNLEKLWLFNINAQTIPDCFSQLVNLKYLVIYGTQEYLDNLKSMLPHTEIGASPR